MENNTNNRKVFFEEIAPCGEGYSIINGNRVHIDTLTETEAVGRTDSGGWFAAKKDFGIMKYNLTTALADSDIAEVELDMPENRRIQQFLNSHEKDDLYTVEHFSSWYRRMTGACMTGRNEFIAQNGLSHTDLCSVRFFLDLVHEKGVSNPALEQLRTAYADSPSILEKRCEP